MNDLEIITIDFPVKKENITWIRKPRKTENTVLVSQKKSTTNVVLPILKDEDRFLPKLLARIDFNLQEIEKTKDANEYNKIIEQFDKDLTLLKVNCNDPFCGKYILNMIPKVKCYTNKHSKLLNKGKKTLNIINTPTNAVEEYTAIKRQNKQTEQYFYNSEEDKTNAKSFSLVKTNVIPVIQIPKNISTGDESICPVCNKKLKSNPKNFMLHLKNFHQSAYSQNFDIRDKQYICRFCKKTLSCCSVDDIIIHFRHRCSLTIDGTGNSRILDNKNNNMTQRGHEIQTRLQDIRKEIKQDASIKVLREKLREELLNIQNELNENSSNFNKFDNIKQRRSQIEQYLDKLDSYEKKDLDVQTESVVEDKSINNQNASQKPKMQIIWKHSLS